MDNNSSADPLQFDKRRLPDQRRAPTKPWSRYSLIGRRKKARRAEEDKNYYVDRYESHYFLLITLILILCVLDAYFTLKFLEVGGKELNLLMLKLIDKDPSLAMVFKYVCTALGITFILIHKNFIVFGRVKVYSLIYVIFSIYFLLVMYEVVIFVRHIKAPGL
jgi:hypothetical protein